MCGDAGWQFVSWDTVVNFTRYTITTDNPTTMTMDGYKTVIAAFERIP